VFMHSNECHSRSVCEREEARINIWHCPLRSLPPLFSFLLSPHAPARYLHAQVRRCFPPLLLLFDAPLLLPLHPLRFMSLSTSTWLAPKLGYHPRRSLSLSSSMPCCYWDLFCISFSFFFPDFLLVVFWL
jgi:hypothetical protein